MRWRRQLHVHALVLALGTAAFAATPDPIADRLAVVDKTEKLIADKNETRAGELRARIRALYKLSRAGWAPMWIEPDARTSLLRRRGAARRILLRDLAELQVLQEELEVVATARTRLVSEGAAADAAARPGAHSLARPVPGSVVSRFGRFRGHRSKTNLVSRGVKLASRQGDPVRATHGGVVTYAGPLRDLDNTVVIARDDGVRSVIGGLADLDVRAGSAVAQGDEIARAAGSRVYLEVRIAVGAGGLPIDPAPLLMAR